jgi:hypothetical protein
MRMMWKIQLPKHQRIGLLAIFATGFLVCVAGTIRLYYSISTNLSHDSTWEGFNLWTWETAELDLGIVCASLPCLKALVKRVMPTLFMTTRSQSHGGDASRPPAACYQLSGRQRQTRRERKDGEEDYILGSAATIDRDGRKTRNERESQEQLTKGTGGNIPVTNEADVHTRT